jgi:perosamine synthetase
VTGVLSIPYARPSFFGKEEQYLVEAFRSTWVSGGSFVERFEHDFTRYTGATFALSASNGTSALHMAYLALGIGRGDEVVVPGFGFLAAANLARHVGATPIFAEVDPETWCLSASTIEPCLSPRTRLIVPVHTYGNVCDVDAILALAGPRALAVVEDAAEAFPSRHRGRFAGRMGTIGTFSFQATKTITTGEGGMVVTEDRRLYDAMWLYRNHGMRQRRYWHEVAGHNFRMTNLQAALGCAQLEALESIVAERKRVQALYWARLADVGGITLQRLPREVDPVLWSCAVKLDPSAFPQGRDAVISQCREAGIETRPGFYAASLMGLYETPALPVCEAVSRQVMSLPTYPGLRDDEIALICDLLRRLRA